MRARTSAIDATALGLVARVIVDDVPPVAPCEGLGLRVWGLGFEGVGAPLVAACEGLGLGMRGRLGSMVA